MNIYIFTEFSAEAGYGHFSRCSALFHGFRERNLSCEIILSSNSNDLPETSKADWSNDPHILSGYLQNSDIAIFDTYRRNAVLDEEVKKHRCLVVSFDDGNIEPLKFSKILIQGVYNEKDKANVNAMHINGPEFQLLRKPFWETFRRKTNPQVNKVVLTLGGTAKNEELQLFAGIIREVLTDAEIHIISPQPGQTNHEKTFSHHGLSAGEVKEQFTSADLAISGGGQSLFELAATGTPTIALMIAPNQKHNIELLQTKGFIKYAGVLGEDGIEAKTIELIKLLKDPKSRQQMADIGGSLIDGQGTRRVVGKILATLSKEHLNIKKAQPENAQDIFDLSNDPVVRGQSFDTKPIAWEDHLNWYEKKLKDPDCLFLIAEIAGEFAGQVRYDIRNKTAVIGISVSPRFRGIGLAEKLLIASRGILKRNHPGISVIEAFVKPVNEASKTVFVKSDYKLVNDCDPAHKAFLYTYKFD